MAQALTQTTAPTSDRESRKRSAVAAATALLGGALFSWGLRHGRRSGTLAKVAGAALLAESLRGLLTRKAAASLAERRHVDLKTSLIIERPVHEVFEFLHDFESLPRLTHLLDRVDDFQNGRSRWVAHDCDGGLVTWEVIITKYVPNTVIGWSSPPSVTAGGISGSLRFRPLGPRRTQLDVTIACVRPRSTALSAVRELAGRTVRQELLDDLNRLPDFIASLPEPPTTPAG